MIETAVLFALLVFWRADEVIEFCRYREPKPGLIGVFRSIDRFGNVLAGGNHAVTVSARCG